MIVKALPQHAGILSTLGAETFYKAHKDSAPAHEITAYIKKAYNLDVIEKKLINPGNIYRIIKHQGMIAGFSKMEFTVEHPVVKLDRVSKMDQIYLLDSFHGLKLGAKLLSYNIDLSKSYGENGMWLVVWVKNKTAISFYEKSGFRIVAEDQFNLTETHINPCYVMLLEYAADNRQI